MMDVEEVDIKEKNINDQNSIFHFEGGNKR
jgi:hypothetical protein